MPAVVPDLPSFAQRLQWACDLRQVVPHAYLDGAIETLGTVRYPVMSRR